MVKAGSSAWRSAGNKCPFENGAFCKFSPSDLSQHLGGKATNLIVDPLADPSLIPNQQAESKVKARYQAGFQDIVQKHFIGQLTAESAETQKVIVIVSHSDGISPFLDMFAPGNSLDEGKYAYCCTQAVELKA